MSTTVLQAPSVLQQPSEHLTGQEFSHLTVETVEFLSTTVSQQAIVLQQPSEHSTGQEFFVY